MTVHRDLILGMYEDADTPTPIDQWLLEFTHITIPNTVTEIYDDALKPLRNLVEIVFPSSVEMIGIQACASLKRLIRVAIGNGVTHISRQAFWLCVRLTDLDLGQSVQVIESSAFRACSELKSVHFPNSVTHIHDDTFKNCGKLGSVTINDGCRHVGRSAFFGCVANAVIEMPQSIMAVGKLAFSSPVDQPFVLLVRPTAHIEGWEQVWADAYADEIAWLPTNIRIWAPDSVIALLGGPFAACTGMANVPVHLKVLPGLPTWTVVQKFARAQEPHVLPYFRAMKAQDMRPEGGDGLEEKLPYLSLELQNYISWIAETDPRPFKKAWVDDTVNP
jgi:hypothetical protein